MIMYNHSVTSVEIIIQVKTKKFCLQPLKRQTQQ